MEDVEQDTKQCPFCGGEIKKVAIKCKHCGQYLNENNGQKVVINVNDIKRYALIVSIGLLLLVVMAYLLYQPLKLDYKLEVSGYVPKKTFIERIISLNARREDKINKILYHYTQESGETDSGSFVSITPEYENDYIRVKYDIRDMKMNTFCMSPTSNDKELITLSFYNKNDYELAKVALTQLDFVNMQRTNMSYDRDGKLNLQFDKTYPLSKDITKNLYRVEWRTHEECY